MRSRILAEALMRNPDKEVFIQWQRRGEKTVHTSSLVVVDFDEDGKPYDLSKDSSGGDEVVIVARFDGDVVSPTLTADDVE